MVLAYSQMHDMGAGSWVLMSLGAILVGGMAIGAVLLLLRSRDGEYRQATASELLDRRLADGAISVEEYERLRDAMRSTPART